MGGGCIQSGAAGEGAGVDCRPAHARECMEDRRDAGGIGDWQIEPAVAATSAIHDCGVADEGDRLCGLDMQ